MENPIEIFLTDTHICSNTEEINLSIFNQLVVQCKKFGLKRAFHLGDIFESRKAQPLSALKTFEKILDLLYNNDIKLIVIPGNHDKSDYRSKDSYLDVFKHHPGIFLVNEFESFISSKNVMIHMIPFFNESDTYGAYLEKCVKSIDKSKINILLTHIAVNGVKNNDGSKVENNLTKESFKVFDKVLIGHYHNQSVVGKNIVYIGSAYQANFGEDNKKGFCVLYYGDRDLEYIKSEFPEYKEVVINLENTSPSEAEKLLDEYKDSEDNVRFTFKGSFEQVNAVDKNKFKKQGVDVKVKSSEIEQGIIEATNNEFVSFDKNEIENEFDSFCQINKIENFEVGKKYLKQILN